MMGFHGFGGRVLYGQATIERPSGALQTVEFQVGTVSAVSSTSITVSSAGHSQTYAVLPSTVVDSQEGGISTVADGDQVRVLAVKQNSQDSAVDIVDLTKISASRQGFGLGPSRPATGQGTGSSSSTRALWSSGGRGLPGGQTEVQ